MTSFAALVLAALPLFPGQKPLAPEDVFEIEYVSDPQISPDGSSVVYVRRFADVMSDRMYGNLWIVNADRTEHRPLTSGKFNDGSPRWSPDGRRLAFVSDREGSAPQIFVRWMDTGATSAVTRLTAAPSSIAWSPDGSRIAFVADVPYEPKTLAKMPAPPPGAAWADPARVVDRLVYRFDGAGYLPAAYSHVFTVPADGGTPSRVTSGDFHHGSSAFGGGTPAWAPDGKSILVSAVRRDDWEFEPLDSEIFEFPVGAGGGEPKALTKRVGPDNEPAISPDGRLVAFTGFDDRRQGYQVTRLYVMNRDGSGPRVVSEGLDRDVSNPVFSSDGSAIYAITTDHGNSKIVLFPLAGGGEMRTLASDVGAGRSAYGFDRSLSVARNGAAAFPWTRPDVPGDAAVVKPGGPVQRLTAVNDDLFSQRTLGPVEEIRFESSHDGREIQGWIVKPPDFGAAGKKWPLILDIHGGPFADYGDRFDVEKQMFAAHGYAVLYVNPRGSTSYGEEFGNLIHHAYPGDDFFDLNSGVDSVLAQGWADPENVFVTGGSGGGVLTCWMVGRSDRFRAAASLYPVINWTSWVLSSDIPSFGVRYWFPGPPWEHPEHYAKRSLLSVVGNVKTPTMVMTGEDDYRTPMSESEQYYTALKLRRVDSVLVRFPGESHGIAGRPSHHVGKMMHILGWFDRYRKKSAG